jgi:hypothetical protein
MVISLGDGRREERGRPAMSLHFLSISDPALFGSFGQGHQLRFKSRCEAVEYGVLLFLTSIGATEDKGFIRSSR